MIGDSSPSFALSGHHQLLSFLPTTLRDRRIGQRRGSRCLSMMKVEDMWKVYLDMKEYAAALANCRDPYQRDQVYLVQAEAAFSSKDYFRAASFYAKINYILSFEEITLKFISAGEQDALRIFLLRKLDNLEKDDKCQITVIFTWATELYLDKVLYYIPDTWKDNFVSHF